MALSIKRQMENGVEVLALRGRLVFGDEASSLRQMLNSLFDEGKRQFVLNLQDVTYVDSGGLGELVRAHGIARKAGGSIRLTGVGGNLRDILQITSLLNVFEVFPTVQVAVGSFGYWCVCDKGHGSYVGPPPCPQCPPPK